MKVHDAQTHSSIDPSQLPLEALAGNTKLSDEEKVGEVSGNLRRSCCGRFSRIFASPSWRRRNPTPTVNGIYSDMINNQLADSISRSGTFGLARSLQGQLSRQVLPQAQETLSPSPKSS